MIEIGVDIESINRFKKYDLKKDADFLKSIFSEKELDYCYSHSQPAKHLTARFCAKEAFVKATSDLNINLPFNEIEITNKTNGKPYLNLPQNEMLDKYEIKISMSHEKDYALAAVILTEKINNVI